MTPGLSKHRALRPLSLLVASGLLVGVGCSSDPVDEVAVSHPTMIEIPPESFLGDVPCTLQEGGLTRYVATLTDVTARNENAGGAGGGSSDGAGGEGDVTLASSAPVSCRAGVGFGFVVPGRQYTAVIEGYDTTVLRPRAPGSPLMVAATPDAAEAELPKAPAVAPRWRASCPATTAVSATVVQAVGCTALELAPDAAERDTELVLSTKALLGGLECGDAPGQVERFSIRLDAGEPEPRLLELPCDPSTDAVFSSLKSRVSASAFVTAFSAESLQPLAGATCNAVTSAGARVTANCAKLNLLGTLRVNLVDALAQVGLACSTNDVSTVQVDVTGETALWRIAPPDCLQPFDHGFPAGAATLTLAMMNGEEQLASLTCSGVVVPGAVVPAICEQND
jgi:hypothetical protein